MGSVTDEALSIDLVVDTSALVAVLLREDVTIPILERFGAAQQPGIAAPTRTEFLIVAQARLGLLGMERACEFLERQAMVTVRWDQELADAAAGAFTRFGRGHHPAGLNFGDTFSYALAHVLRVPLLFVRNGFSQTDVIAAL